MDDAWLKQAGGGQYFEELLSTTSLQKTKGFLLRFPRANRGNGILPDDKLGTQKQTASTSSQDTSRDEAQKPSQEEMQRLYLEQQRRLACPGCGEEPFLG